MERINSKSKLLIATVAVLFGIYAVPTAVHANTYTVVTTNDTLSGSCGGSCSLRDAVVASNNHAGSDTIVLSAGTYQLNNFTTAGEDVAASGDLDLTDTSGTLTISGEGSSLTTINGNATDRIFDIMPNVTVEVHFVTITNGSVTDSNGGAINNRGTLTIENSSVTNSAIVAQSYSELESNGDRFGVGIACVDATLNMDNVTVSGNEGTSTGGNFIYGSGVALGDYDTGCDATIEHSIIDANAFDINGIQFGGGIAIFQTNTNTVTVTDSTFSNNTAVAGGGVFIQGSTGVNTAHFNRVTIDHNHVYDNGAGVYTNGLVKFTNATVFGNEAYDYGGGIYVENSAHADARVYSSTIIQNYSQVFGGTTRNGGGTYVAGSSANLTLNGSIIAGNKRGAPAGSPVVDDCYEPASNNDTVQYSLLGNSTNCNFTTTTGSTIDPASVSYLATATLEDFGGFVKTVRVESDDITDVLTAAHCTDADAVALTIDARGFLRPENIHCDLGAYELDQTVPSPVTSLIATPTGNDIALSWNNPIDSDFAYINIRRSSLGFPDSLSSGSAVGGDITDNTYTNTDLSDARYYYSVFALDTSGNSSVAAQVFALVDATTLTPTLNAPTSGSASTQLQLQYTLPEMASSVEVILASDTHTYTFNMDTTTSVNVSVDLDALLSTTHVVSVSGGTALADGSYTVTLRYRDTNVNSFASAVASNVIIDRAAPTLTLVGDGAVTVTQGDTYADAGAEASDAIAGDLSNAIEVSGTVDTSTLGDYVLTYAVSDTAGNAATPITRTVTVEAATTIPAPAQPAANTITIRNKRGAKIVQWSAVDSATSYRLKLSTKKNITKLLKIDLTALKFKLTKLWIQQHLVDGKTYRIQLKACNTSGCSVWSSPKLTRI